jgi:hypothetical protein
MRDALEHPLANVHFVPGNCLESSATPTHRCQEIA